MLAKSELMQLLSRLPEEALAATLILSVVFTFITIIVTVVSIANTHKSITLAQMSKELIEELLAKGYSPREIEPLVNGPNCLDKMRNLFAFVKDKSRFGRRRYRYPAPPVKQTMV